MDDSLFCVCDHLTDKDKLSLLSTTNRANKLKNYVFFELKIKITKIKNLFYFDRFTNLISEGEEKLPYHTKSIYFLSNDDENGNYDIPDGCIKLRLGMNFELRHDYYIPPSVKRLTIYDNYHDTKYISSKNIEHISLRIYDYRYLHALDLSPNITSLKLFHELDDDYKNIIPHTVTQLCIDNYTGYNSFGCIPTSITHVKIYGSHLDFNPVLIPPNVTHVLLIDDIYCTEEISDCYYGNIPDSFVEFIIRDKHKRTIKKK